MLLQSIEHGIECPICRSHSVLDMKLTEVEIFSCKKCSHRFTNLESICNPEGYTADYFEDRHSRWFSNPMYGYFKRLIKKISSKTSNINTLLDVGCGNGDFLRFVKKEIPNCKLIGTDPAELTKDDTFEFVKGDFLKIDFAQKFDVVVSNAVIEHISDVRSFATALSRHCAVGGIVSVMTINDSSMVYSIARLLSRMRVMFAANRLYSAHHVNHFSAASIKFLFDQDNSLQYLEHINHSLPSQSMDTPFENPILAFCVRLAVRGMSILDWFLGRAILQTVIYRKVT